MTKHSDDPPFTLRPAHLGGLVLWGKRAVGSPVDSGGNAHFLRDAVDAAADTGSRISKALLRNTAGFLRVVMAHSWVDLIRLGV